MRKRYISAVLIFILLILSGCQGKVEEQVSDYDGRTFYEIFVRAFKDSDGDGIGDLRGVTDSLDYLEDLGVQGLWLMPINSSPSYHGYDVTDYYSINSQYGTLEDLKELIVEADKRDIMIVMDMVINHTSSEHPWFKEASSSPDSKYRDYYIFTEDEKKSREASPMGAGAPWVKNSIREEYYYALFWGGMPDLNFDNEGLREELKKIAKFYLELGIDGFRLDAAKWIYNNTEDNLQWWREYNSYVKEINPKAVLIGEVWDNISGMEPYAEVLDSFFVFSMGEDIIKGLTWKNLNGIGDKLSASHKRLKEKNPDFVPAPFLSNHDQNRVMNQLMNIDKYKAAAVIYLTMPGTPYIYYGEELGMSGKKPDERIREPFLWSENLKENTQWIDITNDSSIALENQRDKEDSLFNLYKTIINLRKNNPVLRLGDIEALEQDHKEVYAVERTYEESKAYIFVSLAEGESEVNIEKGSYNILYSNINEQESLDTEGKLKLKAREILIIKKAD
ncbi:alpha-amylase family glycosyl hydrolase [Alloiococcus sp. CFN-8]|uniref:alpha-amylase family glycosyl hydrolase n=1 Tax=Alloiococcus sp. CFN-8 TaxID=3416081 RepID=UPI003CF904CF